MLEEVKVSDLEEVMLLTFSMIFGVGSVRLGKILFWTAPTLDKYNILGWVSLGGG